MKSTIDRKKALLKQYHTVCHLNGLNADDKDAILVANGVTSSTELSEMQLQEIINKLSTDANQWRKRVFAAIGAWLRTINKAESPDIIRSIACRASKHDDFNKIPVSQLRSVYYEFVQQTKTRKETASVKAEIIQSLELQN